jgi:hypothetical protein
MMVNIVPCKLPTEGSSEGSVIAENNPRSDHHSIHE